MEAAAVSIGASMISTILQPLVEKAAAEIATQCDLTVNIEREISNLQRTLNLIQGIIEEAEEKQHKNEHIRVWLRELVDIGYEARDVLDEFITISSTIRAKNTSRPVTFGSLPFCNFLPCSSARGSSSYPVVLPIKQRFQLANEIRRVRKRLDEMMKLKEIIELKSCAGTCSESGRTEVGPFVNKQRDLFIGRKAIKNEIMEKVLNYNDDRVHVVPIWGMGGVGKTTLAQSVYNDERVPEEQYPNKNRRWLWIGEKKLDAKAIALKIIDEKITDENIDVESLQRKLKEKFEGNRFLIVLDDVWDVDSSEWKLLWDPLTNVGKGGLIIITTRAREVILTTNTRVTNDLKPLSYKDCWQIFESHAFPDENSNTRKDLKYIGHQIVKEINGLPLAAEVVGRSLSNELDVTIWKKFLDNREWRFRNKKDDVMPALRWSYNCLPLRLKRCFVYCSLFPKDYLSNEDKLVEMWMANDLIQTSE